MKDGMNRQVHLVNYRGKNYELVEVNGKIRCCLCNENSVESIDGGFGCPVCDSRFSRVVDPCCLDEDADWGVTALTEWATADGQFFEDLAKEYDTRQERLSSPIPTKEECAKHTAKVLYAAYGWDTGWPVTDLELDPIFGKTVATKAQKQVQKNHHNGIYSSPEPEKGSLSLAEQVAGKFGNYTPDPVIEEKEDTDYWKSKFENDYPDYPKYPLIDWSQRTPQRSVAGGTVVTPAVNGQPTNRSPLEQSVYDYNIGHEPCNHFRKMGDNRYWMHSSKVGKVMYEDRFCNGGESQLVMGGRAFDVADFNEAVKYLKQTGII